MYKKFFGLSRNPFENSPDPHFLYPTHQHNEVLACLYYGVQRKRGFVVLTGDVGTGKTLLVRCLLEVLQRDNVSIVYVFNTRLSVLQFFQYIMGDLGLDYEGKSKTEMLLGLNHYLMERHRRGQTTLLVVDEAQHLSRELLEEVRLLSNLETTQQKLLQIILIGQPELDQKLDSHDLRQLKQRIALRCSLSALREEETHGYVIRRLELAGARTRATALFPEASLKAVHCHSQGVPRIINTLCENALLATYAKQVTTVSPETIDVIARDFRLGVETPRPVERRNGKQKGRKAILRDLVRLLDSLDGGELDSERDGDLEEETKHYEPHP